MKTTAQTLQSKKGFTLIELLIVIAVLGILAAVVLVAINPLEQVARGRDSGRKNALGQLSNALQAYYTTHSTTGYPTEDNAWISTLVSASDLKTVPGVIDYGAGIASCSPAAGGSQNNYCYVTFNGAVGATEAIVYARLESSLEADKCREAIGGGATVPYFLWSSSQSQAGVVCETGTAEPTGASGYTFVQ